MKQFIIARKMKRYIVSLFLMLFSVYVFAVEWIPYGYTKYIYFKNGVKEKEISKVGSVKFAFEGSRMYMENLGFPGYTTGYCVFEGYSNGNMYYSVWFEGKNILDEYFGPTKSENLYFLVSTDKSTINYVSLDTMGRPLTISVYQKANTAPIERMYK